jgi:hypothetical protein
VGRLLDRPELIPHGHSPDLGILPAILPPAFTRHYEPAFLERFAEMCRSSTPSRREQIRFRLTSTVEELAMLAIGGRGMRAGGRSRRRDLARLRVQSSPRAVADLSHIKVVVLSEHDAFLLFDPAVERARK